jgi:hypothetical protein
MVSSFQIFRVNSCHKSLSSPCTLSPSPSWFIQSHFVK